MPNENRRRNVLDGTNNVVPMTGSSLHDDIAMLFEKYQDRIRARDYYESGRISLAVEQAIHRLDDKEHFAASYSKELARFRLLHDAMSLEPKHRAELMRTLALLDNSEMPDLL